MIVVFNGHMKKDFIPSWISRLDESMSVWMNKFTCIGFVFCPRKPHTNSNKYHTICCGEIVIMYVWDIVEGRYHTIKMGRPEFETIPNMMMVVLIIFPTRYLWRTGKSVIMETGFFIPKGQQEKRNRGVY